MPGDELVLYEGNKYNKVSSGDFDQLAVIDNTSTLTKKKDKPWSFGDAIAKLITGETKLTIESSALTQLSKASFGTEDWGDAIDQLEDELVEVVGMGAVTYGQKSLTMAATSAWGPIGGALTELGGNLVTSTIKSIFTKDIASKTRNMYMLPGQWVYINDGKSLHNRGSDRAPAVLNSYDYTLDIFRRRMLKFEEDEEIEVSYGFFVSDADNLERVNIFSMKRMKKEYLYKDDVRAVEMTSAQKMDKDPGLRKFVEAYFTEYGVEEETVHGS